MTPTTTVKVWRTAWGLALLLTAIPGGAQALSTPALVTLLRQGGYVLVMRHASSPRETPSKETANSDNPTLERQLDEAGRRGSVTMGEALRAQNIPLGEVLTSPTYRALETVRLARLGSPVRVPELGDGGQSMQGITDAQANWLRRRAAATPTAGNTFIVTHMPNLSRAFPEWGAVADGEVVVAQPDGKGALKVVGRIKMDEWAGLR